MSPETLADVEAGRPPAPLGGPDGRMPAPPLAGPGPFPTADPYSPSFDLRSLSPETLAAYRQHRFRATFSVALVLLVHVVTLGLLAPIVVARKYAFLPRIRPDDFGAGKASGYLFIPFYNLYWTFVLCRRIVDRLTFQLRLWSLPRAPSRGLATASAMLLCLSAIPYLGLAFWLVSYVLVLPVYLVQIQASCNRLALAAAPEAARPPMRQLERAMLLRWLGWTILAPPGIFLMVSVAAALFNPAAPPVSALLWAVLLVLIGAGGMLWYVGRHRGRDARASLVELAPWIVAGYLQIDRNAAWMVAALVVPVGLLFLAVGGVILADASPSSPASEAVPVLLFGGLLLLAGGYAVVQGLRLGRQMARLGR